jgi:hypothetical protein
MNQEGAGNFTQYTSNFSQEPTNLNQESVLNPSFNGEVNLGIAPPVQFTPAPMQFTQEPVQVPQQFAQEQMQFGTGAIPIQEQQMQFRAMPTQEQQMQFGVGSMGQVSAPAQTQGQIQFVPRTAWDSAPEHVQQMIAGMSSSSSVDPNLAKIGETFMNALHTRDEEYCLNMLAQIPDPTYLGYVNQEGDTFLTLACKRHMETLSSKLLEYPQFSLKYIKMKTDDDIDGATHTALGFANESGLFSINKKLLVHPEYCLNNIFDLVFTLEYACEHNYPDIAMAILSPPYNISINLDANGPYYSSPHENTAKICYPAICDKNIFSRAKSNRMTAVVDKLLSTATDETKYILMEPVQDRIDLACDTLFATLDHSKIQLGMKLSKELTQKMILDKIQVTLQKFGEYSDQVIAAEQNKANSNENNKEGEYDNPYVSARSKKIKRKLDTMDDEDEYAESSNYNQQNAYVANPYVDYSHNPAANEANYSNEDDTHNGGKKSRFA